MSSDGEEEEFGFGFGGFGEEGENKKRKNGEEEEEEKEAPVLKKGKKEEDKSQEKEVVPKKGKGKKDDEEEEAHVPKKGKGKEEAVPKKGKGKGKEKKDEEGGETKAQRFTWGRGFHSFVLWYIFAVNCGEFPQNDERYKNNEENNQELCKLKHDSNLLNEKLAEAMKILDSEMEEKCKNDQVLEFYRQLSDSQFCVPSKEEEGGECAWSGKHLEERVLLKLYRNKEKVSVMEDENHTEKEFVASITVSTDAARILSTFHQVIHMSFYLVQILKEHNTRRDFDFHTLRAQLMPTYHGDSGIINWKLSKCSLFEKQVARLFASVNLIEQWVKKLKK